MQTLVHKGNSDGARFEEAAHFFRNDSGRKLLAILLRDLYEKQYRDIYFWLLKRFSPTELMSWIKDRPDIRGQVVSSLLGIQPALARKQTLEEQIVSLTEELHSGTVTLERLHWTLGPQTLATYGDAVMFWQIFYWKFPWTVDAEAQRDSIRMLLDEMLMRRILTALDVCRAIDPFVWANSLPLDLQAEIYHDQLVAIHSESRSFVELVAERRLVFAPPFVLVKHLPLESLKPVFLKALEKLGIAVVEEPVFKQFDEVEAPVTATATAPSVAGPAGDEAPATTDATAAPNGPSAIISMRDQKCAAIKEYLTNTRAGATIIPSETPDDVVDCLYQLLIERTPPKWTTEAQEQYTLGILLYLIEPSNFSSDRDVITCSIIPILRGELKDAVRKASLPELKDVVDTIVVFGSREDRPTNAQMRKDILEEIACYVEYVQIPEGTPHDVIECLYEILIKHKRPKWRDVAQEKQTLCALIYLIDVSRLTETSGLAENLDRLRSTFVTLIDTHVMDEHRDVALKIVVDGTL